MDILEILWHFIDNNQGLMGFGIKPWYLEVRLEVHFVRYTCLTAY